MGKENAAMERTAPSDGAHHGTLWAAGLAAVLASTCCLGPLLLLALGFSGAWIGSLGRLEPYRPLFLAAAAIALVLAGRTIFRPARVCAPGTACSVPSTRRLYRVLFVAVAVLTFLAFVFPYVARFFY